MKKILHDMEYHTYGTYDIYYVSCDILTHMIQGPIHIKIPMHSIISYNTTSVSYDIDNHGDQQSMYSKLIKR